MNAPHPGTLRVGVDALAAYPERIDVRSPAEFAADHVAAASNHPVLDDAERARIGTLYTASPFEARKRGAALVARNIAAMLETAFAERAREWRPLVYCWRGGQRSRALTQVLNEVGWRAVQLEGGYRAYRRHVRAELARLPARLRFVVICGLTGSGKSRLLAALARSGAQTLDLEGIARHRGSLLGDLPGDPQPSQKWFESQLFDALGRLDGSRPVFVESESRRIGSVQMPDALLAQMRVGRALTVVTPLEQRVALLKEEYAHFLAAPASLGACLEPLVELHGKAMMARWGAMAAGADWDQLVAELLETHYDPMYTRSLARNFPSSRESLMIEARDVSAAAFATLAGEVRAMLDATDTVAS
ncbi:MAG: tRNA 2-selenouridine(34) synthase MnmH [Pseudomonadota bacterium]|nr:tRNA 2-selenouridine(34) synthase MnmH [Pseudomonadota bacterium]